MKEARKEELHPKPAPIAEGGETPPLWLKVEKPATDRKMRKDEEAERCGCHSVHIESQLPPHQSRYILHI
jgi:hypothetical protein